MFCTKCGYNAGTAKFCPKCGNPLNPQPVQETPVQNEPVAQTVQSEPVAQQQFGTQPQFNETVQPQFGTQPQSGTVPPVNADVPRYQQAPPMQPQPKKKKKKWPIVVAIIAVIVAAAAVLGFVVLPNVLSPDKHAIAAIKKLGTGLEDTASSALDNMSLTSVSDKNQITGTLSLILQQLMARSIQIISRLIQLHMTFRWMLQQRRWQERLSYRMDQLQHLQLHFIQMAIICISKCLSYSQSHS